MVHEHSPRIAHLLHISIPHNISLRHGPTQPLHPILRLPPNLQRGTSMAPLLLIPLLRTLQRRLCIPHVLFNSTLPTARGGRFSRQAQRVCLNAHLWRVVDLLFGAVCTQQSSLFGICPDFYDDLCLGTEE